MFNRWITFEDFRSRERHVGEDGDMMFMNPSKGIDLNVSITSSHCIIINEEDNNIGEDDDTVIPRIEEKFCPIIDHNCSQIRTIKTSSDYSIGTIRMGFHDLDIERLLNILNSVSERVNNNNNEEENDDFKRCPSNSDEFGFNDFDDMINNDEVIFHKGSLRQRCGDVCSKEVVDSIFDRYECIVYIYIYIRY